MSEPLPGGWKLIRPVRKGSMYDLWEFEWDGKRVTVYHQKAHNRFIYNPEPGSVVNRQVVLPGETLDAALNYYAAMEMLKC